MDLATFDLFLDILLKGLLIVILVFVFLMLRNLDRAVKSLERSFESMERSADTVEDLVAIARYLPFVGGKRDK